jgi:hypothetical protein
VRTSSKKKHQTVHITRARCRTQDGKIAEEVAGVQLPKLTRLIQQLSSSSAVAQRSSSSSEDL